MSKTVVVGMSGGVDSSVAAWLLKEQGYHVIGVTMQIWQEDASAEYEGGCCGLSAVMDARRVAQMLDIPYYVMNFRQQFKQYVMDYFAEEYRKGRTPNPCIACNRYVKWEALLHRSMEIGADYIATGHYARIQQLANGRYVLGKSATADKDQTYALYSLTQEQLSRTLMPVGDYTKQEIRQMAADIGLNVADKPDSQEICFIPDKDYAGYIKRQSGRELPGEGNFVDQDGNVVGRHKGIIHYTIGQRKGLNLSLGKPVFVTEIRPESNEVVIGSNQDCFTNALTAKQINYMAEEHMPDSFRAIAKIRYAHSGAEGLVERVSKDTVKVTFDEPQRAITPGQAVVFYQDDFVLGGGVIEK